MQDTVNLGGFTVGEWKEKRRVLRESLDYSENWEEAIDWYNKRLQLRYFEPMKKMKKDASGEGFSLVTIHCALIEHFASITQGKIHNHKRNKKSPKYEYSSSSEHFKSFLKESAIFSDYFTKQEKDQAEFKAADFYTNVRCALLHDACTRNNWTINTLSCRYSNPHKRILVKESSGEKRLYRDILTEKLSVFLDNYKIEMISDEKKRLYFARKIDHLCEIKPDDSPWWVDSL